MTFNSYIFILLFLPITLIGYFLMARHGHLKRAHVFLIGASILFIAYGGQWFSLVIFGFSIAVNYIGYALLKKHISKKKIILIIMIFINVILLGGFKYVNSFISHSNNWFGTSFNEAAVILPIGISFYTFQQLSFLVDTYRGEIEECSFIDYLLYMCYFPRFISGPIVFEDRFLPQLKEETRLTFNWENFSKGFYRFSLGLGKKIVIADTLGKTVDLVYGNIDAFSNPIDIFIAVLSFTLQLYFDFSGYTDMAIGVSNMFNFSIPENFDSPYKALNIKEFWDKWHISLTNFLTKYIYFSLGGSRAGKVRTYINILIVFIVSGLWHGTYGIRPFLIWGALHGIASVIYRIFGKKIDKLPPILNWFITFNFVNLAWIPFRTQSMTTTHIILNKMCSLRFLAPISADITGCFKLKIVTFIGTLISSDYLISATWIDVVVFLGIVMLIILSTRNTREMTETFKPTITKSIVASLIIVFCMLSFSEVGTFIYAGF